MSESPEGPQPSLANESGTEWFRRLEQNDRQVAAAVKKAVQDLQELVAAAEDEAVGQLLAAVTRVDDAGTQSDILSALLEEGRRFASRTAFFLTQPAEVRGWAGRGFGAASISGARLAYGEDSVWTRWTAKTRTMALSAEQCAEICRGLDAPPGNQGVLIPFMLRGQLGGALYADRLEGEGPLGVVSLQLLTHAAAQSIETAAVRGGGSSPTLRSAEGEVEAAPLWQAPAPDTSAVAAAAAGAAAGAAAVAAAAAPAAEERVEEEAVEEEAAEEGEVEAAGEPEAVEPVIEEPEAVEPEVEEPAPVADDAERLAMLGRPDVSLAPEAEPEVEAVDFEMVSAAEVEEPIETDELYEEDLDAVGDISAELEPEPELEDTGELWEVEEEDETYVGEEPAEEPIAEEPPAAAGLPGVGQETVRLDVADLQDQAPAPGTAPGTEEDTAKLPQWEVEPPPEPTEVEPSEPLTAPMATPRFDEDATVVSRRGQEVAPPEPPPPPASTEVTPPADMAPPPSTGFAPPPAGKPEATGSTQVVPPTDIQGPGTAFASSAGIPEGEEALHEEARRLARLLVSEIKLYNEEIIEEGRRAGNIYERLKDDIDRSRQMYEERIDPRLLEGEHDYFRRELVQRLAGGDEKLLGY